MTIFTVAFPALDATPHSLAKFANVLLLQRITTNHHFSYANRQPTKTFMDTNLFVFPSNSCVGDLKDDNRDNMQQPSIS
jgi:hypothetical protein